MRAATVLLLVSTFGLAAQQPRSSTMFSYPKAHTGPQTDTYFGTKVADPFRWLEDLDSPETRAWIDAENKVTADYLAPLTTRPAIQKRLEQIVNFERYGSPEKHGSRYFYGHNTGLQNQTPVYWAEGLTGEPHILIDPNTLAKDGTIALNSLSITDDGTLAATALAEAGSDWQKIHVREVATGRELPDVIQWTKFGGAAWLLDNSGFFYGGYDAPPDGDALKATNYFMKIFFHKLGTPQSEDKMIFERKDDKEIFLGTGVTDEGRYLIVYQGKGTSPNNVLAIKDLSHPDAKILNLIDKPDAAYSPIGNNGTRFWLLTTLDASNGKVIEVDLEHPEREYWKTIVPESKSKLESVTLVHRTLIANYLTDARNEVKLFSEEGKPLGTVELPGVGTVGGFGGKREDTETFYTFTNFTTPGTVYRLDLATGKSSIYREPKLSFQPAEFETKQVFVTSKDGTKIPVFLSYKKGLKLDGNNPTILYAYGGFGVSLTPAFSSSRIFWMQQGGIYAQAGLRGGGEYGETWHEAGMKLKKQNVFDDFIACAEWLIANKYTSTPKLAIQGGSNGGLLVGAVTTQRPELFGATLPAVGVMDMLRFDKFTVGWGWKQEYGSPSEDEAEFHAIYKYSPLHTLKPGTKYPATMITTADHDDRVFPAHSFKFAAQMQADQAGPAPVLIRIETRAGHGGGMPITKQLEMSTDIYAFLIKELKMTPQL
ncbi:prolyl oligopeptidase family serine peptidase [Terriglobus saanensis]|uniref:prolyl oligopeptidase n=1 Tax=Terriglobus saanensis (strain ATCC BAA-1853 / DSM 23119 / SP1PR4) TaxID=401053 RepID=E8V2D1_TERSS|nr:prolyl oligopeptidase family serine peptidase [Terriglobus saanensis]ADV81264.1 Prolyl oligopeptidase [Terriglobus saanensis SP1PR4]